jgi:hypothetical protein
MHSPAAHELFAAETLNGVGEGDEVRRASSPAAKPKRRELSKAVVKAGV